MNQPVCIYLESNLATRAAAAARSHGATASVKVESLGIPHSDQAVNLFILESDPSERQKVIDSIAEAQKQVPALASHLVRCPNCHSIQIEYPEHPKRSPVMRSLGHLLDLMGRAAGIWSNGRFSCRHCGHLWEAMNSRGTVETDAS